MPSRHAEYDGNVGGKQRVRNEQIFRQRRDIKPIAGQQALLAELTKL
jgi:hypothetical protein